MKEKVGLGKAGTGLGHTVSVSLANQLPSKEKRIGNIMHPKKLLRVLYVPINSFFCKYWLGNLAVACLAKGEEYIELPEKIETCYCL